MSAIDWGDVPTWLGAVFAAGAAGAAVWTLASQRAQIKEQREFIAEQSANLVLERAALEAGLDERRSEQARQVRFEVSEEAVSDGIDDEGNQIFREEYHLFGYVRNESREPLHEATVCVGETHLSEAWEFKDVRSATLGAYRMRVGKDMTPPLLVAAETNVAFRGGPYRGQLVDRPVVLFTDHGGYRWCLDENGDLRRVA